MALGPFFLGVKMYKAIMLIIFQFFFSFSVYADKFENCDSFYKYGKPFIADEHNSVDLCNESFALSYNTKEKIPNYAIYTITKESQSKVCKLQPDFRPDPRLPVENQSSNKAYYKNKWDKGHIMPRATSDITCHAETESVYYTNSAPQDYRLNRYSYRILESRIRNFVSYYDMKTYVVTGTVCNGSRYVGDGVCVPEYFYKAIYTPGLDQSLGIILPNKEVKTKTLDDYIIPIKTLEGNLGIRVFDIPESVSLIVGNDIRKFLNGNF